ncbi:MAG: hypothetical protein ACREDA_13460 [Methylocella sp.]
MSKSLLKQLPQIVAEGKRNAERIMERPESISRIGLLTRELVISSRDTNAFKGRAAVPRSVSRAAMNRLMYGDNVPAMAALPAGDDDTPSTRGKADLTAAGRTRQR